MDMQTFGVWLEERLADGSILKRELARRVGVTPAAVSQWISGETVPADRRIPLLARCLRVTPYEIYLHLGRIAPRGEWTPEWELYIHKVEQYGPEFRRLVIEAVDSMREAWFTRPRGVQAYLDVSVRQAFSQPSGFRGPATWQGEKLLYFGPLRADSDIALMLTAKRETADTRLYVVCGQVIEAEVRQALLRVQGQVFRAECRGSEMMFEKVPLHSDEDRLFLYADVCPP